MNYCDCGHDIAAHDNYGCQRVDCNCEDVFPVHLTIRAMRKGIHMYTFRWSNERELQDGIAQVLKSIGFEASREHSLGKAGRPDFMVEGVAVELKVQGSRGAVLRQLHRYAEHDDVLGVLLVTPSLKLVCPDELVGKPAGVCRVPRL